MFTVITGEVVSIDDDVVTVRVESYEEPDGSLTYDDFEATLDKDAVAKTDRKNFEDLAEGDTFEFQVTREWLTTNM